MVRQLPLCLLALLACGCGSSHEGSDAGMDASRPDGAVADSGSGDAGNRDSGRGDSGPGDDAGSVVDAGIDCSTIGCGAPPACGTACDAPCGCCSCGSEGICAGTVAINCGTGTCTTSLDCGDAGCLLIDGVATCNSCSRIEAEYTRLTEQVTCAGNTDCHLLFGSCGVGLGGCYYPVKVGVSQAQLDALSAQWTALGCEAGRPVCRCAAPPDTVSCDTGTCVAP